MHAVLDTKPGSIYNDKVSSLYHFPSRYKKIIDKCIGDWVVFREPRDSGGRMAYIAHGRIKSVTKDAEKDNHYYAHITDYEDFDELVPWRLEGIYWEQALRDIDTPKVGIYMRGRSVRDLTNEDFSAIIYHGAPKFFNSAVKNDLLPIGEAGQVLTTSTEAGFESAIVSERVIVSILSNKKLRDHRFRSRVLNAYSNQCAFTGFTIRNEKGSLGLQAAHILSVEKDGPDIIPNGLALTHTAHWMFDNYILSLDDNYKLLVSEKADIPKEYLKLLMPATQRIFLPQNKSWIPNLNFIRMHRKMFLRSNYS